MSSEALNSTPTNHAQRTRPFCVICADPNPYFDAVILPPPQAYAISVAVTENGGAENARLENAGLELSGTGNAWNATCGITYLCNCTHSYRHKHIVHI